MNLFVANGIMVKSGLWSAKAKKKRRVFQLRERRSRGDKYLANRNYDDYDAIMDACCDAWNLFVDTPNKVKNLCSRSWANL